MSAKSGSDSQFRRSEHCSPAKQRHCLCSAALPPGQDAGCSSSCWLRRQSCETDPLAVVDMELQVNVSPSQEEKRAKMHLTLLRRATQHARKRRSLAPNTLHARIVLLPPLQTSNALSVLRLHLLEPNNIGLQPPRLVITAVWSESLALRIHLSREPSESPVQTLSSRLRHAHLLLLCISRPARVSLRYPPPRPPGQMRRTP